MQENPRVNLQRETFRTLEYVSENYQQIKIKCHKVCINNCYLKSFSGSMPLLDFTLFSVERSTLNVVILCKGIDPEKDYNIP